LIERLKIMSKGTRPADRYATPERCAEAVAQDGRLLRHVPEHLVTEGLCAIAVRQDVRAWFLVPDRFRTNALEALVGEAMATSAYTLYRRPNGLYQAGCRKNLTLAQALAHWGTHRRDKRARVFRAALRKEQQRLAAQGAGQAA
jgi:hypothetical protein